MIPIDFQTDFMQYTYLIIAMDQVIKFCTPVLITNLLLFCEIEVYLSFFDCCFVFEEEVLLNSGGREDVKSWLIEQTLFVFSLCSKRPSPLAKEM